MDPEVEDERRSESDGDPATLVKRFGTAVGAGVVVAVVASIPAALRVARDGQLDLGAWRALVALAALGLPFAIVAVGLVRRVRVGLRVAGLEGRSAVATAIVAWGVGLLGLLSVVGTVLKAKTHHHGLAATTFAVVALVLGVGLALLAGRVAALLGSASVWTRRAALGMALLAAFASVALVGIRTAHAADLPTSPIVVDVLAVVVASIVLSSPLLARARLLALVGVPAAAAIAVLGLSSVRARPALEASIDAKAPAHALGLVLVGTGAQRPALPGEGHADLPAHGGDGPDGGAR